MTRKPSIHSQLHGLTASTLVVLPEEHEHEYQEVLRGFRESFNPYDAAEATLVERLAQTQWRTLRSRRVETGILQVTADAQRREARELVENCPDNLNPHEAIGLAFMTMPDEHWQNYMRYDTAISRDFFKTLDALQRLQRTREQRKPAQPVLAVEQPFQAATSSFLGTYLPLSENGIRSVSQNSTAAAMPNKQNNISGAGASACTCVPDALPSIEGAPAVAHSIRNVSLALKPESITTPITPVMSCPLYLDTTAKNC